MTKGDPIGCSPLLSVGTVNAVHTRKAIIVGTPTAVGSKGFYAVPVSGVTAGRVRVTISYTDGSDHVASYYVMPPLDKYDACFKQKSALEECK